ncbi:MAG: hypothetical protein E6G86_12485 [Alphaproteobacteria bacterium]|nr:MAG: hypothetical protein E6G86_12485 [Alphaproteobacteria bacterium]
MDTAVKASTTTQTGPAAVTAGFLNTDWSPRDVPDGTVTRNVVLRTADTAAVTRAIARDRGDRRGARRVVDRCGARPCRRG